MGDLVTLLGAIGSIVLAATSTLAFVVETLRSSKKERKDAAAIAAERTQQVAAEHAMDELLEALGDGKISAEEIAKIRQHLHEGDRKAEGE